MTVKEIMERCNEVQTGKAIAYIKDALDEMAIESPTHTKTARMDVVLNQRFYKIPNECGKVLDIRVKHHNNDQSRYKSIPRSIFEPTIEDTDGI